MMNQYGLFYINWINLPKLVTALADNFDLNPDIAE